MVIITINSDDINDLILKGGLERFTNDFKVRFKNVPSWLWFYNSCHLARLIAHDLFHYNYLLLKPAERILRSKESLDEMGKMIYLFTDLSNQCGFKLFLVFHPYKDEVIKGQYNYISHLLLKLKLQKSEFNVLDMLRVSFKKDENINKYNYTKFFWTIDGHNNSLGYSAFARGVEKKLQEMGIITF